MTRSLRLWLIVLVGCGALLRVWQFSANTALWLDEIAIARNVIEHPVVPLLTSPLDYHQSAPKGFLAAEKAAVAVAGPGELALRAWPLAASIASLVLLAVLAVSVLDPVGAVVTVACLAFATPLITQATEVKQYSFEVAVAILLMLFALPRAPSRRFDVLAGVGGAVAIWFSQPAVLVALAMALVLAHDAWRARTEGRPWLTGAWRAALWTASAGAAAVAAIRTMTPVTRSYMQEFWRGGFPPHDLSQVLSSRWPWPAIYEMFGTGVPGFQNVLGYPLPAIFALLSLLGLVLLVSRGRAGWVVTLPVLVTIAAAAAGQYPFRDRLILFLLPSFFIGLGCAVSAIHRRVANVHATLAAAVTGIAIAGVAAPVVESRPPYTIENMKPVMSAMQAAAAAGDVIYVHANAASAFTYYAPRYGIPPTAFTIGSCHFPDGRAFLHELDRFRGLPRVWVVVTHIISTLIGQRLDLLGYLDAIGRRQTAISVPSTRAQGGPLPAEAFLYDLSDSDRLRRITAEEFDLQGRYSRTARACTEGPISMVFGSASEQ